MKFALARTKKFKKSFKKLHLQDKDEAIYIDVVSKLLNGIVLDEKYEDHFLKGNFKQYKECHLKPDLLLVYRVNRDEIQLIDIGSHGDLFD
ncbi:MAG: type II toxin-antitoxin system YafQ family toxin [Thermodesulfobacteriota bacterium]|nr:type II toxin-antitoxin system YafQ family toxin [Thermodesulfobacteriota bacterium]